ncbi:MAG TPA: PHP domain-containing protein [Pyrinomonadaceae bacterium]|nr:PHP domain-containing protein [Pyrinomonadaceae bacterium]
MPEQKPQLDKFGVAAALQEIAQLMEMRGGQYRFKAKAYNAGARSIQAVGDLDRLVHEDRLTSLPRIGTALASQITQLYLTGESSVLNELRKEFPPGIIELSTVPGLSLAKIKQLHDELGISSVAELKAAAEAGQLRNLKGFGAKTEQRLLEQIAKPKEKKPRERLHLHHALSTAERVIEYMRTNRGLVDISFAGDLRRWVETVGTVEIVASGKKPAALVEHFLRLPLIATSQIEDENHCIAQLADSAIVSFTATTPAEFATVLFARTGSQAHVDKVTQLISGDVLTGTAGVSPATHGGVRSETRQARRLRSHSKGLPRSEKELYERAGMQHVEPELREDLGEVEAALAGELPEDLLALDDIKGMVHCHTTYSDGKHTLEQMVRAAEAMGMKYITITDHSPTAFYAGGLKTEELYRQWDEIDELQSNVKIKILRGTESDILADGGLDYPDRILEQLDCIVASVHARYKMDSRKMTERIVTAMQQPVFKVWGHALGRLLQRRPPFECDVERILDVIAESRAAVEINGDPYRLDLEPRWVREALKRKIKFVISVDAHSVGALNNVKFGVAMARRAGVRKAEVLNTFNLSAFSKAVRP